MRPDSLPSSSERTVDVQTLYELANGYSQVVPGGLDRWRDYLAAKPTNRHSGSEYRCVRAREIVITTDCGEWEAINP